MDKIPAHASLSSTNTDGCTPNDGASGNTGIEDDASHYQSLSSTTRRPVEASPPQHYEPLHSKGKKADPSPAPETQIETKVNTEEPTKASIA
jgi:hypothetical protein